MPRDANGNYTLPAGNPVVSGTTILSTWANSTMPDLGDEMTNSLSRDGAGAMLAPLKLIDGDAVDTAMTFTTEPSLGMYRPEAGVIGFAAGSAETARIKVDGNISVAAAAPAVAADLARKDYVDNAILVNTFSDYLDGYESGGLHELYTGDVDAIVVNSNYEFEQGVATNIPADFPAGQTGFITTDLQAADDTEGTQAILGITGEAANKTWSRSKEANVWGAWEQSVGGATISDTPPDNPSVGQGWWDDELGRAFIWYDDGTSSQWVEEDPPVSNQSIEVAEMVFDQKLDGYQSDGNHVSLDVGVDLDTILVNSNYQMTAANPNSPPDMTNNGFLTTDMRTTVSPVTGLQTLVGRGAVDTGKVWVRQITADAWEAWILVVDGASQTVMYGVVDGSTGLVSKTNGGITTSRTAAGSYLCTFDAAQPNQNFNVMATIEDSSFNSFIRVSNTQSASFSIRTANNSNALADRDFHYLFTRQSNL